MIFLLVILAWVVVALCLCFLFGLFAEEGEQSRHRESEEAPKEDRYYG